jgi:hypothetical protein
MSIEVPSKAIDPLPVPLNPNLSGRTCKPSSSGECDECLQLFASVEAAEAAVVAWYNREFAKTARNDPWNSDALFFEIPRTFGQRRLST